MINFLFRGCLHRNNKCNKISKIVLIKINRLLSSVLACSLLCQPLDMLAHVVLRGQDFKLFAYSPAVSDETLKETQVSQLPRQQRTLNCVVLSTWSKACHGYTRPGVEELYHPGRSFALTGEGALDWKLNPVIINVFLCHLQFKVPSTLELACCQNY